MPFTKIKCSQCGRVAETLRTYQVGQTEFKVLKCGHFMTSAHMAGSDPTSIVSEDGRTLRPFQVEGVKFIEDSGGRCLLGDEMRLGKTVQFLSAMKLHPEAWPFLCVVKSATKDQWLHEIYRWTGLVAQVIETSKTPILPGVNAYIISYDLIRRFVETRSKQHEAGFMMQEKVNRLQEMFEGRGLKTICLDECQQIKNPTSQRTVAVRSLCANVEHVIGMSGYPIKNHAGEFFPILNILKPEMFPRYSTFVQYECQSRPTAFGYKIGGLKYPERFHEKTKHFIIRRERKDVEPEMPKISRDFQFHELGKVVQDEYIEIVKQYQRQHEINGRTPGFMTNAMAYLAKMRHLTGLSKIDPCIDYVMEFLGGDSHKKITIFIHHKDVGFLLLNKLASLMKELELEPPIALTADIDSIKRTEIISKFTQGNARVLIASTLAAGEGLTLYPCADCIMLERQFNPANEEQAENRFPHIDQKAVNKIISTYFIAIGTVDEFLTQLVEQKREICQQTLGSNEVVAWDETSLMKDLAELIAAKGGQKWGF